MLLDAAHPQIDDTIDWLFRVSRRHEVLWFEVSFDPRRPGAPVLRSRRPHGPSARADDGDRSDRIELADGNGGFHRAVALPRCADGNSCRLGNRSERCRKTRNKKTRGGGPF